MITGYPELIAVQPSASPFCLTTKKNGGKWGETPVDHPRQRQLGYIRTASTVVQYQPYFNVVSSARTVTSMSEPSPVPPTLQIGGYTVPRLCFGLGSLMQWAPGHTHPIPTDSSSELKAALDAGFRHIDCGDLYTNTPSTAQVLREAKLPREDLFISLKLNTYSAMKPAGRQDIIDSAKRIIEDFGLEGYVDVALLHFPPRGKKGNLTNREAWAVMEELKDLGLARVIGVSNW